MTTLPWHQKSICKRIILKKLKIQLQEKENELSKNLQTFVLNPNICNLVTEISDIKEKISLLEDNNNGEKSD